MRKLIYGALVLLAGCGTFILGNVHPQAGKTAEQQQLDTLACKDQANLAVNSAGRQAGDFLLGFTIVGAPVAYEMDKAKQREVFADCMHGKGYAVTQPDGRSATSSAPTTAPTVIASVVPGVEQLAIELPPGFAARPLQDAMKAGGSVFFAVNHTVDIGFLVSADRHEGVSDLMSYALTKRANKTDRLKDATSSEVSQVKIGGRQAYRYTVTGTLNKLRITYVTTVIEGHDQIIIVDAWTGVTNAEQQKTLLEGIASTVSGIS